MPRTGSPPSARAGARDAPGAVRADTTRGTEAQNSMCAATNEPELHPRDPSRASSPTPSFSAQRAGQRWSCRPVAERAPPLGVVCDGRGVRGPPPRQDAHSVAEAEANLQAAFAGDNSPAACARGTRRSGSAGARACIDAGYVDRDLRDARLPARVRRARVADARRGRPLVPRGPFQRARAARLGGRHARSRATRRRGRSPRSAHLVLARGGRGSSAATPTTEATEAACSTRRRAGEGSTRARGAPSTGGERARSTRRTSGSRARSATTRWSD